MVHKHMIKKRKTKKVIQIPFRDLSVTSKELKTRLLRVTDKVLSHGRLIDGPEVQQFEEQIANYCGVDHCIGVSSGTDALYLALRSLGLGPGDQVITTPLSWIATLNAINMSGCEPIFVDIGEDLNMNPDLVEEAITARTKAIVPVHFTGKLCNMESINRIAERHNLFIVEDAAQSLGAMEKGRFAGSFGHVNSFSFNPMKVLPAYGEAGAVLTNDSCLKNKLKALRCPLTSTSLNFKIDTLQAAMMLVGMDYVEAIIARRIQIAKRYNKRLRGIVECPEISSGDCRQVFFDYVIKTPWRDELIEHLTSAGIETKIKHPVLMPNHTGYKHLKTKNLPVAEQLVGRILSLPANEKITDQDVDYVSEQIEKFHIRVGRDGKNQQ